MNETRVFKLDTVALPASPKFRMLRRLILSSNERDVRTVKRRAKLDAPNPFSYSNVVVANVFRTFDPPRIAISNCTRN